MPERPASHRARLGRPLAAFGRFWWDFVVGDTPELTLGAVVALVVVWALVDRAHRNALAVVALPVLVVAVLWFSLRRQTPGRRRPG